MSKTWYPEIDYSKCQSCAICVNKCTHGVYVKGSNRPIVNFPDGCQQGCHGCGSICPQGAIEYFGEVKEPVKCGCSGT